MLGRVWRQNAKLKHVCLMFVFVASFMYTSGSLHYDRLVSSSFRALRSLDHLGGLIEAFGWFVPLRVTWAFPGAFL